jgi:hypothetical protein
MSHRIAKRIGIITGAIIGAAFLAFWSVPSSVDFLLKVPHRWKTGKGAP